MKRALCVFIVLVAGATFALGDAIPERDKCSDPHGWAECAGWCGNKTACKQCCSRCYSNGHCSYNQLSQCQGNCDKTFNTSVSEGDNEAQE